jgi:hypothetical protein
MPFDGICQIFDAIFGIRLKISDVKKLAGLRGRASVDLAGFSTSLLKITLSYQLPEIFEKNFS